MGDISISSSSPTNPASARQAQEQGDTKVSLTLDIDPVKANNVIPWDGKRDAFALVPRANNGNENDVRWERVDLPFQGEYPQGRFGGVMDVFQVAANVSGADLDVIKKYGVAFGYDTQHSTVWVQYANENARLMGDGDQ